jgi:hypothetical protein
MCGAPFLAAPPHVYMCGAVSKIGLANREQKA